MNGKTAPIKIRLTAEPSRSSLIMRWKLNVFPSKGWEMNNFPINEGKLHLDRTAYSSPILKVKLHPATSLGSIPSFPFLLLWRLMYLSGCLSYTLTSLDSEQRFLQLPSRSGVPTAASFRASMYLEWCMWLRMMDVT